jgi:hypothetical protein
MNTHTPGPWTVGPHQRIISSGWSIRINDDSAIAYALGEKNPELQANARLIAAAPDLLQVLQDVLTIFAEEYPGSPCFERARAAITKAGQEPTA